ncbi:cardiolipin synthase [Myxococcota bacterium]|nr:cardiolipin synthase [Myxococcota bacterium]
MELSWTLVAVVETIWVAGLAVWIVLERRSPTATLAWILGLTALPVVGIPVYLFLGPRRLKRKRLRVAKARAELATRKRGQSAVVPDAGRLMRLAAATGEAPPAPARAVDLYFGGAETYAAIEAAIRAAKHHVHVEYYIWEADKTGQRLVDALTERAAAGVEVRVLVDALGSPDADRDYFSGLLKAGGKVAWFNPVGFASINSRLLNFRTHRKIVVVDGVVGFTGGINVSDVHTAEVSGHAAWRDTHARIEGPAVAPLQVLFCEDWHFATGSCPTGQVYFPDDGVPGKYVVQVLGSGPDHDLFPIHKLYFSAIAAADQRVFLATPYFVPDEPILTALSTAALRGVDVRVLVPKRGDSRLVTAAAKSYFAELVSVGVKIYEYEPAMMHAKTMVIDDELTIVGTANLDNRSFRLNFECALAIAGAETAERLAREFERDLTRSTRVTTIREARTPLPQRLLESTARLLSPLL